MNKLLQINFSPRIEQSLSAKAADMLASSLYEKNEVELTVVNVADLEFVSLAHIGGFFSNPADHSEETKETLKLSNQLISDFLEADTLIYSFPTYNFNIPAIFKAYIDLIVRSGKTFSVDENGFKGLVDPNKQIYTVMASSGTPVNSPYDFATPYLKQIFGFMGVPNIQTLGLTYNQQTDDLEAKLARIKQDIQELLTSSSIPV